MGETAPTERVRRLMDAGVTLVRLPGRDGRIGLPEVLAELQAREVRGVLVDLGTRRQHPNDPREPVFAPRPSQAFFFPGAVERARATLADAQRDTTRLEGYVWHSNRHTFASRLAMAGVDLLTLKELGGWKTLSMVQRYAHLRPGHLQAAVERLVSPVSAIANRMADGSSSTNIAPGL